MMRMIEDYANLIKYNDPLVKQMNLYEEQIKNEKKLAE